MDTQLETIRDNAERAGDLQTLIERLEKATGPDRILDALLDIALDKGRPAWAQDTGQLTADGDCVRVSPTGAGWYPPRYTSSVDLALDLLLPDKWWCVSGPHTPQGGLYRGGPKRFDVAITAPSDSATGATPALALCVAALKARVSL